MRAYSHGVTTPSTPPALEITDLKFSYQPGQAWTVNVSSLTIAAGEQMLLTGGSGSGKSTLLQLIAGLLEPTRGRVLVAGESVFDAAGASRDKLRGRRLGMIFQTFNLLQGFTALENVMASLAFAGTPPKDQRPRAAEALASLGLSDINRPVEAMSVGQQQRVAVARAVVTNPALVLADEPTASLDPENAAAAMTLIQQSCKARGAALLCVSHDPAMADRFALRRSISSLADH